MPRGNNGAAPRGFATGGYYPLARRWTKADKAGGRAAADGPLANPVRSERKQP